jgi:hypothetical protein
MFHHVNGCFPQFDCFAEETFRQAFFLRHL